MALSIHFPVQRREQIWSFEPSISFETRLPLRLVQACIIGGWDLPSNFDTPVLDTHEVRVGEQVRLWPGVQHLRGKNTLRRFVNTSAFFRRAPVVRTVTQILFCHLSLALCANWFLCHESCQEGHRTRLKSKQSPC